MIDHLIHSLMIYLFSHWCSAYPFIDDRLIHSLMIDLFIQWWSTYSFIDDQFIHSFIDDRHIHSFIPLLIANDPPSKWQSATHPWSCFLDRVIDSSTFRSACNGIAVEGALKKEKKILNSFIDIRNTKTMNFFEECPKKEVGQVWKQSI